MNQDNFSDRLGDDARIVIEKGKQLAGIAYEKGSELAERAKVRYRISESKSQLRGLYCELGKEIYSRKKAGAPLDSECIDDCIGEIDETRSYIELLEETLGEIKGAKICPRCGATNSVNSRFCSSCAYGFGGKGADTTDAPDAEK